MIESILKLSAKPRRDFIYELLVDLQPHLCVDIGAAAGAMTLRMRQAMHPEGQVVAFEPFIGNHAHFRAATAQLTNIRLVAKAVSDTVGTTELYVDSVVRGDEPGWANVVGYSSVGHLQMGRFWLLRKSVRALRRWVRNPASLLDGRSATQAVDTTTLDNEFPTEHIDLIKMDVQGAESMVLKGARQLLREGRVDLMYIEWSGDPAVVGELEEFGYKVFDSTYVGSVRGDQIAAFETLGFRVIDELSLSTGQHAYELIFTADTAQLGSVMETIRRKHHGWIQTDLIAVSASIEERFFSSVRAQLNPP